MRNPLLSVIVPVHQGAETLPRVLDALAASDLPRAAWELIIVDDASSDGSAAIAAGRSDTVLRLSGRPRGPAYARNRGFELARGEIIVFVDADVCVAPDCLRRLVLGFAADSAVAAIVGSYEGDAPITGMVAQYRNLLHRHLRLQSAGEIDFFWPACGAIRRGAFVAAGMFDEWHYWRPQAEGAELGHRLRRLNYRVLLDPTICGAHLKQWTLLGVLQTDLFDIGVPWARLLLQQRALVSTRAPSLAAREKLGTALTWAALLCAGAWLVGGGALWLRLAAWLFAGMIVASLPCLAFLRTARGTAFVVATLPLHALHYLVTGASMALGWAMHEIVGEPQRDASDDAFAEVGLETWPPIPRRRTSDAWRSSPS